MQVAPEFARACTTGKGCYWAIDAQKIKSDQVIENLQALLTSSFSFVSILKGNF
jgi:hypothetical protein